MKKISALAAALSLAAVQTAVAGGLTPPPPTPQVINPAPVSSAAVGSLGGGAILPVLIGLVAVGAALGSGGSSSTTGTPAS